MVFDPEGKVKGEGRSPPSWRTILETVDKADAGGAAKAVYGAPVTVSAG